MLEMVRRHLLPQGSLISTAITMVMILSSRVGATPQSGGPSQVAEAAPFIEGIVNDQAGLPMSGAGVILRSRETGFERITHTTVAGVFTFANVSAGNYE